jgi:hypothetical protein
MHRLGGTKTSHFYRQDRKDRKARQEHRKGHRIIDPSHHRAEKSQIAQINAD